VSGFTDKNEGIDKPSDTSAQPGSLPSPDRRRFSRTALASSAVLLSLGNRSAWGQTDDGCMSVTTLSSFNPDTGMFVSAPGGRPEHNEALAAEIHHISTPNDGNYIGTNMGSGIGTDADTVYSTCQDPNDLDGVCLVEASDCP
jgi:hypothetical protein